MDFFTVVGVYPAGPQGANRAHAVRMNLHTREEVWRAIENMVTTLGVTQYWVFEGASLSESGRADSAKTAADNNRKFA